MRPSAERWLLDEARWPSPVPPSPRALVAELHDAVGDDGAQAGVLPAAAAISSAKKYWSQKVVVPESAISAQRSATAGADVVGERATSSGSRIVLYQPSMVSRLWPSEWPRNSTMDACVWALTRPGSITNMPGLASITSSLSDGSRVVAFEDQRR